MRRTAAAAAETRARVLDSALLTFAEHGYDGATFERIAARIGMTRGAVHHHFRGKDELLAAVLTEQWRRYGEQVLAPLRAASDPATALTGFIEEHLRLLREDPMFRALATVGTFVAARSSLVEQGVRDHRSALDGWRAELAPVLAAPGLLRPGVTVDAALFVLVSVAMGANDTAAIEPERLPADAAARRAVAWAAVAGLLAHPDPASRTTLR
ncbi:TetR family transcriptional regulator [Pseudonocardia sp. CA-107938]|uniref:TetR family transcriptional regulator n=1 Tax=Pseudonocardia sp. CA-107938 TaxID=3240021 RepID=UPI003D8DF72E